MADESGTHVLPVRKSLADRGPVHGFVEDLLLPWPEAGDLPFGAMVCSVGAGGRTDPDRHNQDELVFFYRGSGVVDMDGAVSPVRAGEVILVPRQVTHVFGTDGDDGDLAFFSVWWPRVEPRD